jgi:hypothetical protein
LKEPLGLTRVNVYLFVYLKAATPRGSDQANGFDSIGDKTQPTRRASKRSPARRYTTGIELLSERIRKALGYIFVFNRGILVFFHEKI